MFGIHRFLYSRAAPLFDVVYSRCVDASEMSATSTIIMVWLLHRWPKTFARSMMIGNMMTMDDNALAQ